jgi:uncharacterized protein (DUF433 family)
MGMKTALIVSPPDLPNGTPVFAGTRGRVKHLTGFLEGGENIDGFLENFPNVTRAQEVEFLQAVRTAGW